MFFFQLKGDMRLPVVENEEIKDVHIKESHVFMLPARILHSPQRYENTIGLVVEITRAPWEFDSLRYHVDGTTEILFERWTHLTDVVKDLPPIIAEFKASEACRTGKPTLNSVIANRPYNPDPTVRTEEPLNLRQWIQAHKKALEVQKTVQLYGPPKYKSTVTIYSQGYQQIGGTTGTGETFLYLLEGTALVTPDEGDAIRLAHDSTLLVPANKSIGLEIFDGGYAFTVYMETPSNK